MMDEVMQEVIRAFLEPYQTEGLSEVITIIFGDEEE